MVICQPALAAADAVFQQLREHLNWRQDTITIHGKKRAIPRLQSWYGEAHCGYTYSGLRLEPQPLPPLLKQLKAIAEELSRASFNCVLCNLYRDGNDSVGWHADDEPELGTNPTIASYSFGAERRFLIKLKHGKQRAQPVMLPDNSLLLMSGEMQHHWLHQLPKTQRPVGGRINLTFRHIKQSLQEVRGGLRQLHR